MSGQQVTPSVIALSTSDQQIVESTKKSRREKMTDEEVFFAVCKEGDHNGVRIFLEDGVNFNVIDRFGNTPLLHAVNGGYVDVARELLEAGADPDVPDRSGHSPLHKASQAGQVDMMKLLVFDYDADLELNDKTGRTSLHLAANNGHVEAVKILISAGTVINSTTTDGYTALHWACWNGRLEVAMLLYEAGADVDCATKFGNTPLHKAIEKKRVQVIKWLVFKGANVSAFNKGSKQPLDMLKYTERLEILNEDNYPLHALVAHRSSLWLQIVAFSAKEGSMQRILSYCSRYPELAYVKDEKGVEVTDMLEGKNKRLMIAMLHWHGRYRLLENVPLYSSASTVVLHAIDTLSLDNLGKPCHVALKFLLNKDRYRREIDTRACKLSDEYVLNVMANYPKYSPETMQIRLNPTYHQQYTRKQSSPHALSRKGSIPIVLPLSRSPSIKNPSIKNFTGSNRRISPETSPQLSPRIGLKNSSAHTATSASTAGSMNAVSTNPPHPSSSAIYMNSAQYVYFADESSKDSMPSETMLYLTDSPELKSAPQDVDIDFNDVTTRSNGGCELTKEEAEKLYCVVLPLAQRTLYVAMKHEMRFAGGQTTVTEVKAVFSQLLRCVSHFHDACIIHGDIKPMNIVFHSGRWKLTDLDSAVVIGELPIGRYSSSSAYMPPECFFIDEATDEIKVGFGELSHLLPHVTAHQSFDIWSLGCILYQLCNEDFRLLFSGDQLDNLSTEKFHKDYVTGKISTHLYQNSLWALHEWSDDLKASKLARVQDPLARSLLSDMLHKSPGHRPTIDEILIHPFLTGTAPNVAETTSTRRGTHLSQSVKVKVEAIHASAPPSSKVSRSSSMVGESPGVDGSPTSGLMNMAINVSTKKEKKGSTQSYTTASVGFSQSERLQGPERGTESGSLIGNERLSVPGCGPESDIVMESIPRPTSTGSRVDVHRALYDVKEGENMELRAQLAEAKEEKLMLLTEMERLRARLGASSVPIAAATSALDMSTLPISGAE